MPGTTRDPTTDREMILDVVRRREAAIREDLASLALEVDGLRGQQAGFAEAAHKALARVQDGIDELTRTVTRHLQAESEIDARRDEAIARNAIDLARLASSEGARSGRGAGARWGVIVSAVVGAVAYVIEHLIK